MQLVELRLTNVRNVAQAGIALRPGVSEFVGENGAGKTSILEAAYMLSHGRSFRPVKRESLIRFGCESLDVFAVVDRRGRTRRLGLSRRRGDWAARVDGAEIQSLAELLREVAVVCFEPGSHALISGGAEERRHYVDWALFHVEPEFAEQVRRYRRALKQRNVLLRGGGGAERDLEAWDLELAKSGLAIDGWRRSYLEQVEPVVEELSAIFIPELGMPSLAYQRGWTVGLTLIDALTQRRERDRERGHTSVGPHRGDWRISFVAAPEREHLSRGQEKLSALVCLLAQAELFHRQTGEWPIVCLDDLASELDVGHQTRVLEWLDSIEAQVLITGTAALPAPVLRRRFHTMFHVEQGAVTTLL
ncbi:DNA replication/repair protein RecF [Tahibacter caeni]|uniref:DNA replication/repair protein RecF n=1 Tax=Tahibacter caeni TaxID=1453545 RepID=UPI002149160E|nr:DNA replication/repair protein RecF [Tahibacter caeni]